MSSANETSVTVAFDPNSTSKQADIIGPASANKAGVMTAQQAVQLAELVAGGGGVGPLPGLTGIVYVNKGGNDATADGSAAKPFLTIQAATSFVTDATPEKRYVLLVGPGRFNEPVVIKPWVFVVGVNATDTYIGGAVTIGPEWNIPAGPLSDARGGFATCTLAGAVDIDFNAVGSFEGKFYAYNAIFNSTPVFTAFSPINQVTLDDVRMFAGYTQNGISAVLANVYVEAGAIAINSINDGRALVSALSAFGGGSAGPLTATWGASVGANAITVQLLGFAVQGIITMDGAQASLTATVNAIAQGSPVLLNSAPAPVLLNGAGALGYTPAVLANWSGVQPVSVQSALDRLAAAIGPIP